MTPGRRPLATIALYAILLVMMSTAKSQAQMSIDEEYDIGTLMRIAEQTYDLTNEDAILLLDGLRQEWSPDGKLTTVLHQIVWISTDYGIEEYADRRVPYDHLRTNFNVATVRTWRDGQWWVTGETGMVETLPRAVMHAYDYTIMREMMLLHDGIEIPCILEIAYSIEDKEPFRSGAEGLWTFAREVPAVRSEFVLEVPSGFQQPYVTSDDVPQPIIEQSASGEFTTYTWATGPVAALPFPHTSDPASAVPYITWSTWADWTALGTHLSGTFSTAATLDGMLSDAIDSLKSESRNDSELAALIADFVSDHVRYIDYPEQHWWSAPRKAARIYQTGYGHRLDRAILAAAMYNTAGMNVSPVFIGKEYGDIRPTAPTLARLSGVGLWVEGSLSTPAYYDPTRGSVAEGLSATEGPFPGQTFWNARQQAQPTFGQRHSGTIQLRLDLSLSKAKDSLTGEGFYSAEGFFNTYDQMQGFSEEAREYLESFVAGMLEDAIVSHCNPAAFDGKAVAFGFELALELPDKDDHGRIPLIIGEPEYGLIDRLPDHVSLFDQHRESSIRIPGTLTQSLDVRIDLEGLEVVHAPQQTGTQGDNGTFAVQVSQNARKLSVTRKLHLTRDIYPPDEWPGLRALLLAETHERNQTILLKLKQEAKN